MHAQSIKLSETFINLLINLPETGMGYQIVKVVLKNGNVLRRQKVLNSSMLILEENIKITEKDIAQIVPEKLN